MHAKISVPREDTVPQQSRENSILALLESSQNKKAGEREIRVINSQFSHIIRSPPLQANS